MSKPKIVRRVVNRTLDEILEQCELAAPYSDAERKNIQDQLNSAAKNVTDDGKVKECLDDVLELAKQYKIFKPAHEKRLSAAEINSQLGHLSNPEYDFWEAAEELDRSLWVRVYMFTDKPPPWLENVIHEVWNNPASDIGLLRDITEVESHIRAGAWRCLYDTKEKPKKRGWKRNYLIRWFIRRLAEEFEKATDRRPTADYSVFYEDFGGRATPFVRFVAACLFPLEPGFETHKLGDTVHRALPKHSDPPYL